MPERRILLKRKKWGGLASGPAIARGFSDRCSRLLDLLSAFSTVISFAPLFWPYLGSLQLVVKWGSLVPISRVLHHQEPPSSKEIRVE